MKNDLSALGFFLLFAFVLVFCSNSCTKAPQTDYFSFTEKPFVAELEGNINGVDTSLKIVSSPDAEKNESRVTVVFFKPESICGMNVNFHSDGSLTTRLGDLCTESSTREEDTLFLFLCTRQTPSSVSKNNDGTMSVKVSGESCELEYFFDRGSESPSKVSGTVGNSKIEISFKSFTFTEEE